MPPAIDNPALMLVFAVSRVLVKGEVGPES